MTETPTDNPTPLQLNLVERVNVGDIIARTADVHPQAIALVDGARRLSYAEFERQVTQLGHALLSLGLQQQDVVGVMSRNNLELLLTYIACARAGLICAPVNLGLRATEIAWCLRDARAKVLITERTLGTQAEGVLGEPLPDLAHRFWIEADPAAAAPTASKRCWRAVPPSRSTS